MKLEELD